MTASIRSLSSSNREEVKHEYRLTGRRFWGSLLLSLPLLALAFAEALGLLWRLRNWAGKPWLEALIATGIVFWAAAPMLRRSAASLLRLRPDRWILLGLAIAGAYGLGVAKLLLPGTLSGAYFTATAVLVVLTLCARLVELRLFLRLAPRSTAPETGLRFAPIQERAQSLLSVLVLVSVLLAALSFLIWAAQDGVVSEMALAHAVLVLILASPAALILAAKIPMLVALGQAERHGIEIRDSATLQKMAEVDALLLDKVGFLTEGQAELVGVDCFDSRLSDRDLLALAAALEAESEHPLGRAIRRGIDKLEVPAAELTAFGAIPGKGVYGDRGGHKVGLGNLALLEELGVDVAGLDERARNYREQGQSVVWLAAKGKCIGLLTLTDRIRGSAQQACEQLRADGIELVLLTGDAEQTARRVAEAFAIRDVVADTLKKAKELEVECWRVENWIVAMAGHPLRDAEALAKADVGIAMLDGLSQSAAQQEAADFDVRVSGDLGLASLQLLRVFSRKALRIAKQNLLFVLCYHLVLLPLAAFSADMQQYPLMLAALVSCACVLLVLANSLRLARAAS